MHRARSALPAAIVSLLALTACSGADEAPTDIPEAPPKVSSTAPEQSEEASGRDSAAEAEPSESQDSSTEAAPTDSPSSTQETDPAGGASEGAAGGTGSDSETQESGPAGSDEAETGPDETAYPASTEPEGCGSSLQLRTSKNTGIECERTASGHGFKLTSKEYQLW